MDTQNTDFEPLQRAELSSPPNRRTFLSSVGVAGLVAALGAIKPTEAEALDRPTPLAVGSIKGFKVLRDEEFEIPGGKEHFLDQQITDTQGAVRVTRTHISRTDTEVSYEIHLDIAIQTYASGQDVQSQPSGTQKQSISVHGIKGEISGSVRNDHVTVTTVYADGTTSRQSSEVQVRLDNSDLSGLSREELFMEMGRRYAVGKP